MHQLVIILCPMAPLQPPHVWAQKAHACTKSPSEDTGQDKPLRCQLPLEPSDSPGRAEGERDRVPNQGPGCSQKDCSALRHLGIHCDR